MENNQAPVVDKTERRPPWNKGKLIGPKPPLRPSQVWAIRTRLQMENRKRDLALFNLAIDSKLRGCDVVAIRVEDVAPSGYALDRAIIRQKKTGRPVRFELTDQTRSAIDAYLRIPHAGELRANPKPGQKCRCSPKAGVVCRRRRRRGSGRTADSQGGFAFANATLAPPSRYNPKAKSWRHWRSRRRRRPYICRERVASRRH